MSKKDNLRHLEKMMQRVPGYARDKRVPKCCRQCEFYQPKFRFRKCLYTRCRYGLDRQIFRIHPLRQELIAYTGKGN